MFLPRGADHRTMPPPWGTKWAHGPKPSTQWPRDPDPAAAAAGLVALMTEAERRRCLDGDLPFWAGLTDLGAGGYHRRPFLAARVPRLGIPGFAFSDGPRGVVIGPATCFPVSMARGATWDLDLEERIGDAIGQELRAVGADLYGGVCVNILRHPAWGRAQETYGEDPHHVGELGAALTRGVQRHVMACVKHFACNSMENARFTVDVTIDDEALHEVFLPHFKRIVDEGVACVMSAYNSVNGAWAGQSRPLLTEVLREDWGFDGLRDQRLDLRAPRRRAIGGGRPRRRDARADGAPHRPRCRPGRRHRGVGRHRRLRDAHGRRHVAAGAAGPRGSAGTRSRRAGLPRAPSPRPGGRRQGDRPPAQRACRPACRSSPSTPRWSEASPCWAAWPMPATSATAGRATSMPPPWSRRWPACGRHWATPPSATSPAPTWPRRAAAAAEADVAIVVVGYTKADEGEFIGADGTAHLIALMPGPDDPDEVAEFAARVAAGPRGRPVGRARSSRTRRAASPPAATAARSACTRTTRRSSMPWLPPTRARSSCSSPGARVVMEAWRHEVAAVAQAWYSGMEGGHALADVLLGRVDAAGRLPLLDPDRRGPPTPVRPGRRRGHLRRLARVLAPRARGPRPRPPVRLRPVVHVLGGRRWSTPPGTASPRAPGTSRSRSATPASATGPPWCRPTCAAPAAASGASWASPGSSSRPAPATEVTIPISSERLAVRRDGRWILPEGTYELSDRAPRPRRG